MTQNHGTTELLSNYHTTPRVHQQLRFTSTITLKLEQISDEL